MFWGLGSDLYFIWGVLIRFLWGFEFYIEIERWVGESLVKGGGGKSVLSRGNNIRYDLGIGSGLGGWS